MLLKLNVISLCIIQGSNRNNNVVHDVRNNESPDNANNSLGMNSSALIEHASNLVDPKAGARENQTEKPHKGQNNIPKKWYEGTFIRPVAFRTTSNK